MTQQTMSNQANTKSVNNLVRHQRFGASPLARMRHSKGFTLVELMVVIVIVGILSAVALPRFLGLKDKAKINTQLGEASGLAKECATAIIVDGTYPKALAGTYPQETNTGLTISRACTDAAPTATITTPPTGDIVYKTKPAEGNEGAKCGPADLTAALPVCEITVTTGTGDINYVAKAS